MKSVHISTPGGPEVLQVKTVAVPEPGDGEVLIKVAAAGLNRADILQREGKYAPPDGASQVPGLEVSGKVVKVGQNAGQIKEGDTVCALLTGGGYQEFAVASAGLCLPVSNKLDLVESAALPEALFTVWANVFEIARFKKGESLLVHGGSSGIGMHAIQMGKAMEGDVFTTTRGAEKTAACQKIGADAAFDSTAQDWVAGVLQATQGRGVDVILDMVAGDYFDKNLECLAQDGRMVQIATAKGRKVELDYRKVMAKRAQISGSFLRSRPVKDKERMARALWEQIWPQVLAGEISPVIDKIFDLEDVVQAHRYFEQNIHIGKVLLKV